MSLTTRTKRWAKNKKAVFAALFLLYLLAVKSAAIVRLGFLGDEMDDLQYARGVLSTAHFDNELREPLEEPENARLPHLISLPLVLLFGNHALVPVRVLFLIIHCLFLAAFYRLLRLRFSEPQSVYGTCLVGLSTYLFSFSIFAMTTSNNLFLLFSTLLLYHYLKQFENAASVPMRSVFILSLLAGLCIASRISGVLYLFSLILYDGFMRRPKREKSGGPNPYQSGLGAVNCLFTAVALGAVFLGSTSARLVILAGSASAYLLFLAHWYRHSNEKERPTPLPASWFFITHMAFNLTLLFSPPYLNLKNVWNIFRWFARWGYNADVLINPSPLDIFNIIWMKAGIPSLLGLAGALCLLIRFREIGAFLRNYALFLLIFIVYCLTFSVPPSSVTWYAVPVFPYLYIPVSTLIVHARKTRRRIRQALLLGICLALPIAEHARYLRLFPYGHIDGCQYGEKFIGWSKPGFISFEGLPLLYRYLKDARLGGGADVIIACDLVQSKTYNAWAVGLTNQYFRERGTFHFHFVDAASTPFTPTGRTYYLTGIYTDKARLQGVERKFRKVHDIQIVRLTLLSLWEPMNQDAVSGTIEAL